MPHHGTDRKQQRDPFLFPDCLLMQVCIIDGELGAAEAAVNSGSHVAAALLASSTRELLASDEVREG